MIRLVICQYVCVGFLYTVVRSSFFSRRNKQSRKASFPFSSISLVNWMYTVDCCYMSNNGFLLKRFLVKTSFSTRESMYNKWWRKKTLRRSANGQRMCGKFKNMESNKTPGTDGIPVEFYQVFWNDIKPFFLASINASRAKGLLSISQRRGLLTFIPKKDKALCYIKNWRPISLLNWNYKIAAKSIANRMKRTLPSVINSDQTCFQKTGLLAKIYCC